MGSERAKLSGKGWKDLEMGIKKLPCLETLKNFLKSDQKLSFVKMLG